MNLEENQKVTTLTGLAVAVVALARFLGATNPDLTPYLGRALASAEAVGVAQVDLQLLRTIIASLGQG